MKLVYVCECCDSVIKEVVLPAGLPENAPNLTGSGLRDIMDLDGGEGEVVLSDLATTAGKCCTAGRKALTSADRFCIEDA